MKTIVIGNRTFELINPRNISVEYPRNTPNFYDIYRFYTKPSIYKIQIWEDWCKWFYNTSGVVAMKISGANCMQFSIRATYIDEQNNMYVLVITKEHNRAYKIS